MLTKKLKDQDLAIAQLLEEL